MDYLVTVPGPVRREWTGRLLGVPTEWRAAMVPGMMSVSLRLKAARSRPCQASLTRRLRVPIHRSGGRISRCLTARRVDTVVIGVLLSPKKPFEPLGSLSPHRRRVAIIGRTPFWEGAYDETCVLTQAVARGAGQ